jgi:tetratricopeptide (TPR) repeat protein
MEEGFPLLYPLRSLALIFLAALGSPASFGQEDGGRRSVVKVVVTTEGGASGTRSGFAVRDGRVATTFGAVMKAASVTVQTEDGRSFASTGVTCYDAAGNLALLEVAWGDAAPPPPLNVWTDNNIAGDCTIPAASGPVPVQLHAECDPWDSAFDYRGTVPEGIAKEWGGLPVMKGRSAVGLLTGIVAPTADAGQARSITVAPPQLLEAMRPRGLVRWADWGRRSTAAFEACHLAIEAAGSPREPHSVSLCVKALEMDPDCWYAWLQYALELSGAGRHVDALAAADRALAIVPRAFSPLEVRTSELIELGRPEQAVLSAAHLVELYPDVAKSHRIKAVAHASAGEYAEAASEYRAVLKLDPDDEEAAGQLRSLEHRIGKRDEATP